MRLFRLAVFVLLVGVFSARAEVSEDIHCTNEPLTQTSVDKMISVKETAVQLQCDYKSNKGCRYTEESCAQSIGCANLILGGKLKNTDMSGRLMALASRVYATQVLPTNNSKMISLAKLKNFAEGLGIDTSRSCAKNFLNIHETKTCDPRYISDLDMTNIDGQTVKVFEPNQKIAAPDDFNNLYYHAGCNSKNYQDIAVEPNETSDHAIKRIDALLSGDECFKEYMYFLFDHNTKSNDFAKKFVAEAALNTIQVIGIVKSKSFASFLAKEIKSDLNKYLEATCPTIPSINEICDNVTALRKNENAVLKNTFIIDQLKITTSPLGDLVKYYDVFNDSVEKQLPGQSLNKTDFFRLIEASRCRSNPKNFADAENRTCTQNYDSLRKEIFRVGPIETDSIMSVAVGDYGGSLLGNGDEYEKEQVRIKNQPISGNSGAILGPLTEAEFNAKKAKSEDGKVADEKVVDKLPEELNAKPLVDDKKIEATGETIKTGPIANTANYSNSSNSYNSSDYNIPGTHPMAVDANGVPIPPRSIEKDQQSFVSSSPDVQAIQAKLDTTQMKLDQLTAEVAATKVEAEKKKHQDEVDGLKKEIEKLKSEKARADLVSLQPATQAIQSMHAQSTSQQVVEQASARQEEFKSVPMASPSSVTPLKSSTASKAINSAGDTVLAAGGSGAISGGLFLKQDIIDMPTADLSNSSHEDPAILQLAVNSVGGAAFPVQDKNKIVWTIVPLLKDGKVVSYTAIKEKKVAAKKVKKPEVSRVPASVKPVASEPAKREIFLKDLNGIIKAKK